MTYNTRAKEKIVHFLFENRNKSFSLEEICRGVLSDGHGKSTVYRIISNMVKSGQVKRLTDGITRHFTYQYIGGACAEHFHLKCKGCGTLIHLDEDTSLEFAEKLMARRGFSLDEGAFLIGRCSECSGRTDRGDANE